MNDSQIMLIFCLLSAGILIVVRLESFARKTARKNKLRNGKPTSCLTVTSSEELDAQRERLLAMMGGFLGIRAERLRADADIRHDLGIPPGELDSFLGRVQEQFGLTVERDEIRTVGDLLARIQLRSEKGAGAASA